MFAHYAFQCDYCNISAGYEKGLVEGLVGWTRRNIFVPIPRIDTIEELNAELLRRCIKYRQHKIAGRALTVGEMAETSRIRMTRLPKYKFDPSKTITAKVDSFSTVRFDYNRYSVPVQYAGKDISVKGYGNEVVMMHRNIEIARFPRCYGRGQTKYKLEHYIDLIERRPRSVFNAKPVRNNVSDELLEVGKRLNGPREMVKLLRLYVDYGQDKLMAAICSIQGPEISIEQIQALLTPVPAFVGFKPEADITVLKPQLDNYDALISRGKAI